MRRLSLFCALVASVVLLGCTGSDAPKQAAVKGKVTLDGKPLDSGKITFEGEVGTVPTVLDIKAGSYEGQTTVGEKTVRITAFKLVEGNKTGMTGPEYDNMKTEVNYIPAKYNTESKEVRTIENGKTNEFDFAVTSK